MSVSKNFLFGLPKAELHLHLEGTLEPDLKLALAQKNKVDIGQKSIEEVKNSYHFNDLTSFLAVYYPAMNVLQDESDFYELAIAYLRKAKEQGVRYVEMFFDPQAHTSRGVEFGTFMKGYHQAQEEARIFGVDSKLICCFLRDLSAESAMEHYRLAQDYQKWIVGFGLDSDERDNPPLKFKEVFDLAKKDGYHITIHCDIDQLDSIHHIEDCLKIMGVERIDHGTNIVEDPNLVQLAKEHQIGFTCCPLSNGFVRKDDMKTKEMLSLMRQGLLVTLNSDDPAYFSGYIADNYVATCEKEKLSKEDMVQFAKNSFLASWLTIEEKEKYLAEIEAYVQEH